MERAAEKFLRNQGLILEARNWRCAFGELDLIMRDGPTWVFVEVRYRKTERHGGGGTSITRAKRHRLMRSALAFRQRRGASEASGRFDIVAVSGVEPHLNFRWIRSAFDASNLE